MFLDFLFQNFYKDEINREEMYIRYVNKLHELHLVAGNHTEAGKTLELYAKVLNWSTHMLPKEMRYKEEMECDRKEMLYTEIINCFDKGKVLMNSSNVNHYCTNLSSTLYKIIFSFYTILKKTRKLRMKRRCWQPAFSPFQGICFLYYQKHKSLFRRLLNSYLQN